MSKFEILLAKYFAADNPQLQQLVEQELWQAYGTKEAVMVMDMSGFSLVTQKFGIVYYLSMINRMQQITKPTIEKYNGQLVKFVADNVFARFPTTQQAINASIEINKALAIENDKTPDIWDIQVATGIDFGDFLLTDDNDYFGDVVNKASKLGEDIARAGEILISQNAMTELNNQLKYKSKALEFSISGIQIKTFSIQYQ